MQLIDLEEPATPQKIAKISIDREKLISVHNNFLEGVWPSDDVKGNAVIFISDFTKGFFEKNQREIIIEGDRYIVEPVIHRLMSIFYPGEFG